MVSAAHGLPYSMEMEELNPNRDIESQEPLPRVVGESYCGSILRDYMELTPCALATGSVALLIIFGLYGLGAYYIENPDYHKWGGVAIGAVGVAFSLTVVLVGFCACLSIRHLRPQKNLEGQIRQLGETVSQYTRQIQELRQVNAHLTKISSQFKVVAEHQKQLTAEVEKMLQDKVGELEGVNSELSKTQEALAGTERILQEFQTKIAEANAINDKISAKIKEAGEHVPNLEFACLGHNDLISVTEFTNENTSFHETTTDLERLTEELQNQLTAMKSFELQLAKHAELFKVGAESLDVTDDKLLDAAKLVGAATEKRFQMVKELQEKLIHSKLVFESLKGAILSIEDTKIKEQFQSIVEMIDGLQ